MPVWELELDRVSQAWSLFFPDLLNHCPGGNKGVKYLTQQPKDASVVALVDSGSGKILKTTKNESGYE